jgi:dTDP-4-dehydrorhamnose reductase
MKILLYGSTGMLGSDLKEVLNQDFQVVAPTHKELDITRWDEVIEHMYRNSPDVLINCAAFTDVDACETEENQYMAAKVNVEGARNLAQGSARFDCRLIHISSDYVFSGQKVIPQPYFEDDPAEPVSVFGKSKMEAETAVRENSPDYIIIRTGWLYGVNGRSFIHSLLTAAQGNRRKVLRVVDDQFGSPTWSWRLALQVKEILVNGTKGTYHASSEGYCSRLDYARYIFKKLSLPNTIKPCSSKDDHRPARRPLNAILENRLLKKQGINIMPDWKEDLDLFFERHGQDLLKWAKLLK